MVSGKKSKGAGLPVFSERKNGILLIKVVRHKY